MTGKTSTVALLIGLTLISTAIVAALIGCNERKEIKAPVIGPAAGSGPVGGGETQQIKLIANPSTTVPTIGEEQATVNITALVENNIGQPMPDGTAVYWSTTVGTLDSSTTTTSNGSSTVTLTFPKSYSGCSVVTAQSGDVEASIEVCTTNFTPTPTAGPTPTITPQPTATSQPTVTPGPTATPTPKEAPFLQLTGPNIVTTTTGIGPYSTTLEVCALSGGAPVPSGIVNVSMSIDPDNIGQTNLGSIAPSGDIITDGTTGCATLIFNAGPDPGKVTITATRGGNSRSETITVIP